MYLLLPMLHFCAGKFSFCLFFWGIIFDPGSNPDTGHCENNDRGDGHSHLLFRWFFIKSRE